MKNNEYKKLLVDELSDLIDPLGIKNFILSNHEDIPVGFSFQEPFILDGIVFGICIKGQGLIRINFKEYKINEHSIITLLPNQIITVIDKSDDFFMESLYFSIDFIAELPFPKDFDIILNLTRNPCLTISGEIKQNLLEMHTFIVKQYYRANHIYRTQIIKGQLYILMLEIGAIYHTNKIGEYDVSSRQEELTERFFKLLLAHKQENYNLSFYADKMCLTPKYLSTTIKKVTGSSIHKWINEAIIIESKLLLKTTELTILQISEKLNFPNPSFFGRFFKDHTGITPLKYRNS